ncbi:MAG TPA: carboxypeptidase M32 [Candidatus Hydrogenedentes bacterium]|nr:carboxypeptidase M32 [Candidatus Hydrogenedentota bacterium]
MPEAKLRDLRARFGEYADVKAAIALLSWDQEVYMPPKGAAARGQQLATLSGLAHRLLTSGEMGALLKDLGEAGDGLGPDDRALVFETLHDYTRATQLPEAFVRRFAEEQSKAYEAWVRARRASDFAMFRPHLETMVDLLRRKADYHGYEQTPYDALLADYERGMTTARLREIFGELAPKQRDLVARIAASGPQREPAWLDQEWPEPAQEALTVDVLRAMGYDFEAGRQDKSAHPFTTNFGIRDVRITTRFNPRDPFSALMGSMHEGGHALYEQGFPPEDERSVLAEAPSLGIHESQSRLWENLIGRSLPFWRWCTPLLQRHFPDQARALNPEAAYRALNRVAPSLIRVEADECTYNLHVILRFEIEVALIEGELAVADLPDVWNGKIKDYLGLDVPDDARGCLQDIHWSHGAMGYFPTYALGNLYAAQLFEEIVEDIPALWTQVEHGDFAPLLAWLREHVHRHGRRKKAVEIVRDATGREPDAQAFLRYLECKFGGNREGS